MSHPLGRCEMVLCTLCIMPNTAQVFKVGGVIIAFMQMSRRAGMLEECLGRN